MFTRIKLIFVLKSVSFLNISLVYLTKADVEVKENYDVDHWCYGSDNTNNCGPKTWPGTCRTGKFQSPLDIKPKDVIGNGELIVPVELSNGYFESQDGFYVENNGHSIIAYFDKGKFSPKIHISPGPAFSAAFIFSQIHFHWGPKKGTGSEHKINGSGYVIEMHFVHVRDRSLENLNTTLLPSIPSNPAWIGFQEHREGFDPTLAVIAIFLQVSDEHTNYAALDPILKAAQNKKDPDKISVYEDSPLNLSAFFPEDKTVYQYEGSLTTPPCTEAVWWTIFKHPIRVSNTQLDILHEINSFKHKQLTGNYRSTQPLNGRKIVQRKLDFELVKNVKDAFGLF